jgi:hypothetical protein
MSTLAATPAPLPAHGLSAVSNAVMATAMAAAMSGALVWPGHARGQPVFRCGHTYTNAPPAGQLCEQMPELAVTRIEGTRVHPPVSPAPTSAPVVRSASAPTSEPRQQLQPWRDQQARNVLEAERDKLLEQLQSLEQSHRAQAQVPSQGVRHTDGAGSGQGTAVVQAIDRTRRDLQSLERELARLGRRQEGR